MRGIYVERWSSSMTTDGPLQRQGWSCPKRTFVVNADGLTQDLLPPDGVTETELRRAITRAVRVVKPSGVASQSVPRCWEPETRPTRTVLK